MNCVSTRRILPFYLESSYASRPDHIALIEPDRRITFGQLRADVVKLAAHLAELGVKRGSRVVLLMSNSIDFVIAFWAVLYLGAVVVPVNPDTKAAKLHWIACDCTPTAMIVDAALAPRFEEVRLMGAPPIALLWTAGLPASPEPNLTAVLAASSSLNGWPTADVAIDQDLACILYTSGSTGTPKGVMLSHLNMVSASSSVAEYLALSPDDRVGCVIPFSFDYGLHQATMTALVGATLIVEVSFAQPLFSLHRLLQQKATVFPIVPTMVGLIEPLAGRFDLTSIRIVTSTAAALHPGAIDSLQRMFSKAQIFSMYGLTECHRCTYLDPSKLASHKGSVGKAIPNTELWVIDDAGKRRDRDATGELVIRGSTVMKGYWNNPAKTDEKLKPGPLASERVLYTGDICRIDEAGYVWFISRTDDILKVRGEKVAPMEVEAVLLQHPDVREAAAVGIPNAILGDALVACVAIRPGTTANASALRAWCTERLEASMVPGRIVLVDALPRNQNGKIDKHSLKQSLQASDESRKLGDCGLSSRGLREVGK